MSESEYTWYGLDPAAGASVDHVLEWLTSQGIASPEAYLITQFETAHKIHARSLITRKLRKPRKEKGNSLTNLLRKAKNIPPGSEKAALILAKLEEVFASQGSDEAEAKE